MLSQHRGLGQGWCLLPVASNVRPLPFRFPTLFATLPQLSFYHSHAHTHSPLSLCVFKLMNSSVINVQYSVIPNIQCPLEKVDILWRWTKCVWFCARFLSPKSSRVVIDQLDSRKNKSSWLGHRQECRSGVQHRTWRRWSHVWHHH